MWAAGLNTFTAAMSFAFTVTFVFTSAPFPSGWQCSWISLLKVAALLFHTVITSSMLTADSAIPNSPGTQTPF